MNKKKLIPLLIYIIAILVVLFSFKSYYDSQIQEREVFVFKYDLENGTKITKDNLDIITVPAATLKNNPNFISRGEFSKINGTYIQTEVFEGNFVYKNQLTNIGGLDAFQNMDLSNLRVISLPIDPIEAFSGDVERGDTIDLMYTASEAVETEQQGGGEGGASFVYSKIFLQNIPVYQVNTVEGFKYRSVADQTMNSGGVGSESVDGQAPTGIQNLGSIQIAVTPQQAEEIEARRLKGRVKLLKRFEETETHATLGFVIGDYQKMFSGNANAESNTFILDDIEETETENE